MFAPRAILLVTQTAHRQVYLHLNQKIIINGQLSLICFEEFHSSVMANLSPSQDRELEDEMVTL